MSSPLQVILCRMHTLHKCCYCLPLEVGLYVFYVVEFVWFLYSIVFILKLDDWKDQKVSHIAEMVISVKMLIVDVLAIVAVYRRIRCLVFLVFIIVFIKFFAFNTFRISELVNDFDWLWLGVFFIKISVEAYSTVVLYSYYVQLKNEQPDDPLPADILAELDDVDQY